jgi:CRISPR/Cas system CSM-associated protein Csm3 (group 7 of RAMP superfamily)
MTLTNRYIARIVLEAETGLFVGSGEASLLKDALVQKDHHGLPMIQGTTLCGVLRHSIEAFGEDLDTWKDLFGYQKDNKGVGARLRVSSAYLMINETSVAEGLLNELDEVAKKRYENLPSRQHVRINDKGVADTENKGLFDNEVVYKGTRFIFELELIGTHDDQDKWNNLLTTLHSPLFRIGHGTRNGYGKLSVLSLKSKAFDLTNEKDFDAYLHFDPSFNATNSCLHVLDLEKSNKNEPYDTYTLELTPDSFFIFGAVAGDDEVDNKPVVEEVAVYRNGTIDFDKQTLIPASSIKGALAHRTAYHYNRLEETFADHGRGTIGKDNEAVRDLFGFEAKGDKGQRGRVILSDAYYTEAEVRNDKIFNHVAIDRFTGGAMDGALFSEKVSVPQTDSSFSFSTYLEKSGGEEKEKIVTAFENALIDVCKGLLPLGGMTTKGHGIFTSKVYKNDNPTPLFDYETY